MAEKNEPPLSFLGKSSLAENVGGCMIRFAVALLHQGENFARRVSSDGDGESRRNRVVGRFLRGQILDDFLGHDNL